MLIKIYFIVKYILLSHLLNAGPGLPSKNKPYIQAHLLEFQTLLHMQCSSDFSRILSRWVACVNKSVCIFDQEFSLLVASYELQLSLMYEYSRRTSGAAEGHTGDCHGGEEEWYLHHGNNSDVIQLDRRSKPWASGSVGWCQNRSNRSKELWDIGYVWAKGQP